MPIEGQAKRDYQVRWLSSRRQEWIDSQGGCCVICGSTESLEVDHIDPATKSLNPRNIWNRKQDIRDQELAKCQVLCKKHHLEKTIKEQSTEHPHGVYQTYRRGCRCVECTATVAPHWRQYRANKKNKSVE